MTNLALAYFSTFNDSQTCKLTTFGISENTWERVKTPGRVLEIPSNCKEFQV